MLHGTSFIFGSAPLDAWIVVHGYTAHSSRNAAMTQPPAQIEARARTDDSAPRLVRFAAAGAIAANASFPLIELWKIGAGDFGNLQYAALATAATMALHLRHVVLGLREERLRAGKWTLAALAAVNIAAAMVVGRLWGLQLASLAVSILIVVRGPAALVLVGAVALAPLILIQIELPSWQDSDITLGLPGAYLMLAIIWRTATLYVPVRLVTTIRQIEATRRELESRAVHQTRSRIEGELRDSLGRALERIISEGEIAEATACRDPESASINVRRLVTDSRRALADARRLVTGYRSASLRSELEAATALLEAAGAAVRVIIAADVSLDGATERSRGAIRAAVARALREGTGAACTVHVGRDDIDDLQVTVTLDGRDRAGATR